MGYFGKSITASDTSMDVANIIYNFYGIDRYGDNSDLLTKELVDSRFQEFIDSLIQVHKIDIEQAQTICYQLLLVGAEMNNERIDKFIRCFVEDEWAKTCLERKFYMNHAIECLEKYKTDKTPVDIDIEYDFENFFIPQPHRGDVDITMVRSILKKVLGCNFVLLRNNYSLLVLLFEKDFIRLKGESIFGIKLVTHLDKDEQTE